MKNLFFLFLFLFSLSIFPQEPMVLEFSPEGTVKQVKQVKVTFSTSIVSFGNPRANLEIFDIDCPEKGRARWLDDRTYVYEFEKILPSGIVCNFQLKESLVTLNGRKISGKKLFQFSTGGPTVKNLRPYEGSYIEEDQIFALVTDTPVDESSIVSNVYFNVERLKSKVEVSLVSKSNSDIKKIIESKFKVFNHENIYFLKSKLNFPSSKKVELVWGKGVRSKTGVKNEEDQVFAFQVREPFSVSYSCERVNSQANCIPFLDITLSFSAPVSYEKIKKVTMKGGGKTYYPEISEQEKQAGNSVYYASFQGPFPEKTKFQIIFPEDFQDETGRSFPNKKQTIELFTDSFPPLAKFSGKFGILEAETEALLPLTIRNIEPNAKARILSIYPEFSKSLKSIDGKTKKISPEEILFWMRKLYRGNSEIPIFDNPNTASPLSIPRPNGPKAFEVVGIPLKKRGLHIVELESSLLGKAYHESKKNMYISTAALVTNMAVHFKQGRENSLVWVTRLNDASPISGAKISVRDCNNQVQFEATTNQIGIVYVPKSLQNKYCSYYTPFDSGFLVIAETSNDYSFVHTNWTAGIESWRFNLPYGQNYYSPNVLHTILDRTLFRAGETVNMKHFLRKHHLKGFQIPSVFPTRMIVVHEGSGNEFFINLNWKKNGTSSSNWKIPKEAKLGSYSIYLELDGMRHSTSSFRVEEFRLPVLQGNIQLPTESLVRPKNFDVYANVKFFSGGAASNLPVKLKYWFTQSFSSSVPDYEDYSFFQDEIKEGKFDNNYYYEEYEDMSSIDLISAPSQKNIQVKNLELDSSGSVKFTLDKVPTSSKNQIAHFELEYKDPNGEIQTISKSVPIYASEYKLGIKEEGWLLNEISIQISTIVLDLKNKPVANKEVEIEAYTKKYYSHKRRIVGGFYSYENYYIVEKLGKFCSGKTNERGIFICKKASPSKGNLLLFAKLKGEDIGTIKEVYANGSDEYGYFAPSDSDRMDVLPEKNVYEPEEKAKFQVRMPFKQANALITVEREGVLEATLKRLDSKDPVVSIDIKGNHAPNVFVSVLAVRGRVAEPKPTAIIDLARPSFKLGIAPIRVGWKAHELQVNLTSEKQIYKVREQAKVKIQVLAPNGKKLPPDTELAVAAVDESLLDLQENSSWDLLSAMMKTRSHEVVTSTAQTHVIGRRHFGLKALPQGGGGGSEKTRELFDTLLFWKSSIPVNELGEAEVNIPLNDSLTSFRIVAIANGGADLFGSGKTQIQTTQDLMLFSGLPPVVREGDEFLAELTVRNTTNQPIKVLAESNVSKLNEKLSPISILIPAEQTQFVGWNIKVPSGIDKLEYEFKVKSNEASDKLKITQKVIPSIPVSVQQATLVQLNNFFNLEVEQPPDSLENQGGINLIYSNSLVSSLSGVREYMSRYPYNCLEQQVSRSIATKDKNAWENLMKKISLYLDRDGFAKYFPSSLYGDPILTAYVLAISHERKWELPEEAQRRMLEALIGFVDGRYTRYGVLQTADLTIKKLTALEALSRYGFANKEQVEAIKLDPNLLPTSALLDYGNVLYRVKDISNQAKLQRIIDQALKVRLNLQGTFLKFSSEREDKLWWLMVSADLNSVKLITSLLEQNKWREDIGKIVRGAVLRQRKGVWDLTLANAWGSIALEKFASQYEKAPVTGQTLAKLETETYTQAWSQKPKGAETLIPWSKKKTNLSLEHSGTGSPWVIIQSKAAVQIKEQVSNGYTLEKKIIPIEQKNKSYWSVGDVIRIQLKIKADTDMTWVVVNDPIPSGASILTGGLRNAESLTSGERSSYYSSYEERAFDAYRVYYEYLPEGEFLLEYTIRLNQEGKFLLPQTRIEAMYSPDLYGEYPGLKFEISK